MRRVRLASQALACLGGGVALLLTAALWCETPSPPLGAPPEPRAAAAWRVLGQHNPSLAQPPLVSRVVVVPGGGPGRDGLPPWTVARCRAAAAFFHALPEAQRNATLVLVNSAGSLNGPNARHRDGRIVFESTPMLELLESSLSVPGRLLHGEFMSWDTVTNGLVARHFVDAVVAVWRPSEPLPVDVFTSDFHRDRTAEAFAWAMSASPAAPVDLTVHGAPTDARWLGGRAALEARLRHEEAGVEALRRRRKDVRTLAELQGFVLLGGHGGLRAYLHGGYNKSSGGGW